MRALVKLVGSGTWITGGRQRSAATLRRLPAGGLRDQSQIQPQCVDREYLAMQRQGSYQMILPRLRRRTQGMSRVCDRSNCSYLRGSIPLTIRHWRRELAHHREVMVIEFRRDGRDALERGRGTGMPNNDETPNPGGPDPWQTVCEDKSRFLRVSSRCHRADPSRFSPSLARRPQASRVCRNFEIVDRYRLDRWRRAESLAMASAEGVLDLSRTLVKTGKLTQYQAAALYQKRAAAS